jgi:hypothetical protein
MGAIACLSWRPAAAGDAEWMSGESRTRLALALTEAPSWMADRSALDWASEMLDQLTDILNAIDDGDLQAAAQLPAGW